ncbi:MAG: hypothetical protein F4Z56_02315, partial [Candidatus Dadabacteria bacterium]|nr:hypothetical protein [Candidatus Dadabacteria bacterium]
MKNWEDVYKMRLLLITWLLLGVTVPGPPASAEWVKRDNGRLEWVGEIAGTHKECVKDKLSTVDCFYKINRNYGFKGKKLEEAVNLEKDPTFTTRAVCAEYLWDKPYENYIECCRMLVNIKKNSEGNRKFRQYLE